MFAHCYARGAQQSSFEDSQSGSSMGNKEGLLMKRGEKRKNWLERRFVFNAQARTLSYFDPKGFGGLKGAGVGGAGGGWRRVEFHGGLDPCPWRPGVRAELEGCLARGVAVLALLALSRWMLA